MTAERATAVFFLILLAPGAARTQEKGANNLSVWLPGKPWALELSAPGFGVRVNEIQPGGRRYFLAENTKARAVVSVSLEVASGAGMAEECKPYLQERVRLNSSFTFKGITSRELGPMQVVEYTIPEVDGVPTNQRHAFACLGKQDVYVEVHLSKMFFKPADQAAFDGILYSVHFADKEPTTTPVPVGNSLELFREGGRYFLARQFRQAIEPYRRALEIEKITPTLEKELWRVLVDNLGKAYAIAGEPAAAKETLEYGASKDPGFPMFYYHLASLAAGKGDLEDAKAYLRLAFQYRNNMTPGEDFPDPRVDDSFQRLLLQREFRRFVDSLLSPAE